MRYEIVRKNDPAEYEVTFTLLQDGGVGGMLHDTICFLYMQKNVDKEQPIIRIHSKQRGITVIKHGENRDIASALDEISYHNDIEYVCVEFYLKCGVVAKCITDDSARIVVADSRKALCEEAEEELIPLIEKCFSENTDEDLVVENREPYWFKDAVAEMSSHKPPYLAAIRMMRNKDFEMSQMTAVKAISKVGNMQDFQVYQGGVESIWALLKIKAIAFVFAVRYKNEKPVWLVFDCLRENPYISERQYTASPKTIEEIKKIFEEE